MTIVGWLRISGIRWVRISGTHTGRPETTNPSHSMVVSVRRRLFKGHSKGTNSSVRFLAIPSELLTWYVDDLSAFASGCGCNRIMHMQPSTRERCVCLVEFLAKDLEDSGTMWRTERG